MKIVKIYIWLFVFIISGCSANITKPHQNNDPKTLLVNEFSNCAAYFYIGKHNLPPDLAQKIQYASDIAYTVAVKYSSQKKALTLTKAAINKQMNFVNVEGSGYWDLSKLTDKYAEICRDDVFNTEKRIHYYLNK